MSSVGPRGVAAVVGIGVGVGGNVAKRFAQAGYAVALMGRTADKLTQLEKEITATGAAAGSFVVDAGDVESVRSAFAAVKERLGPVDVLVYNVGPQLQRKGILEVDVAALEAGFRTGCTGALVAAQQVLPDMLAKKSGTILLTGATAALRGNPTFLTLSAPKAALRMLGQSLAREFGPKGIHCAFVIIDGMINLPGTRAYFKDRPDEDFMDPAAVAEQYYQLHIQDKTTWTQELDLRPFAEKF